MPGKFRLSAVFRARQVQEDAAKAEVVQARIRTNAARKLARQYEEQLDDATVPEEGTAQAILATLAARRSLAAGLAAAKRAIEEAEVETDAKVAELAEAAKRRKAVEKLAERHAEQLKAEAQAADQAIVDELAVTAGQRAASREVKS